MSKTKGNVLDPLDLVYGIDIDSLVKKRITGLMQPQMAERIEKVTREQFPNGIPAFGTDALRFTFCALASTGRNIRFDIARLSGYRNFCNKLWNAARFVLMNVSDKPIAKQYDMQNLSIGEKWLLSRLHRTINSVNIHLTDYRFDLLAQQLYEFTWDEFCDWGLEWEKTILQGDSDKTAESRYLLLHTFESLLTLLHPIIPFITERLWQAFKPLLRLTEPSLMVRAYPQYDISVCDEASETVFSQIQTIITAVRNIRAEMNIAPSKAVALFLFTENKDLQQSLTPYFNNIQSLARLSTLQWIDHIPSDKSFARAEMKELTCLVDLADLIDIEAEKERLAKEKLRLEQEIAKCRGKLENPQFVERAPEAVVKQEQQRLVEFNDLLTKIAAELNRLIKK